MTIEDIIKITLREQDLKKVEDELRLRYRICISETVPAPILPDFSENIEQIYEALDNMLDLMGIDELNADTAPILDLKEAIENNLEFIYHNN